MAEKKCVVAVAIVASKNCPVCKQEQTAGQKPVTETYRDGWDRIFGTKQEVGQA